MKRLIKNILVALLQKKYKETLSGASVLMYHAVGHDTAYFSVTVAAFEEQMRYLKKSSHHRVISLKELYQKYNKGESLKGCVVITFDDGYKDNLEKALPILEKYNLPATIFVVPGLLGGFMQTSAGLKIPVLTKEDVASLSKHPLINIEPHTQSHASLPLLSEEAMQKEVTQSKAELEAITGEAMSILAYPKGKHGKRETTYVKNQGWTGAVSVIPGIVTTSDRYRLPRNAVVSDTNMTEFKLKVSDGITHYEKLKIWR